MNFTAIDFETATGQRSSACAVGLVKVENGILVDRYYSLITPPNNAYWLRFTAIHGISWKDTLHAPTYEELYPTLLPRLKGEVLVAHNAPFDRGVLQQTMEHYGLDYQELQIPQWICTLDIYRKKGFCPANLAACSAHFNIELNHHEALSDAVACAKLLLIHNRGGLDGNRPCI